jgi:hypothetical protein
MPSTGKERSIACLRKIASSRRKGKEENEIKKPVESGVKEKG